MRRRDLLTGAVAAAVWPLAARAQQQMPVIGLLSGASANAWLPRLIPFRQALKDAGFVEGENVRIEYRWAEDRYERLPALAAELVRVPVDVIVAAGGVQTALAAKFATAGIPIVFQNGSDPVQVGLVTSLARPGGNLTGVTNVTVETVLKRIELVRDLVPGATVIGYLTNSRNPNSSTIARDMEVAGRTIGRELVVVNFTSKDEFDYAFAEVMRRRIGALVISADPIFYNWRDELVERIARHAIPAIFPSRDFVDAGGLVSYGANYADIYRQVALYTSRILRGARPSELPVVQSTKFELIVNNKTAKTLGLEVPLSLLMRIDAVID